MKTRLPPAALAVAMAGIAAAASLEDTARSVMSQRANAVVPISAVLTIEVPGEASRPQEQNVETYGTIVGPNGLTAVSATALNPLGNIGPIDVNIGGSTRSVSPRGDVSQIRMRLPDGAEVPMRQVLRDDDIDLALLAPDTEAGQPKPEFPAPIVFEQATAQPMDEVIGLGRAGKLFNWAPAVGVSRIIARVEKPRVMYLFSAGFVGGVGTPVFRTDGTPLGLILMRRQQGASGPRGFTMNQAAVILPAADIAELVRQAAAAAKGAAAKP